MKRIIFKVFVSALALLLFITLGSGRLAMAANLKFTPQPDVNGGAIYGHIPLDKLGSLQLPRGRANFKSHMVEISAIAEYQFERQIVLSGPIIKCSSLVSGNRTIVNGIAYFDDGEWLRYIDGRPVDKITTSGAVYEGQITALKNGFVEITTGQLITNVPSREIVSISSPRAYNFSMLVTPNLIVPAGLPLSGDTATVTIKPTAAVISLNVVKHDPLMVGDGDISTKKLVALGSVLGVIQIAQFLPMAYVFGSVRNHNVNQYHARFQEYYQQQNFLSDFYSNGQHIPISPFNPGAIKAASGI